jgi:hypothetical protein
MRPRDCKLAQQLDAGLHYFDRDRLPLIGIHDPVRRTVFLEQLLESIHRVKFVAVLRNRNLSDRRADPNDELFDPLKAAVIHQRSGNLEEAFWLVFLFVHFGKHSRGGWRYVREVYGRLGDGGRWDWASTSSNPSGFRAWLHAHQDALRHAGVPCGFGNHRKRESLDAYSRNGTGATVESYVRWVAPPRTHQQLMEDALRRANADSREAFDYLYHSMKAVVRFGRLARFDYLSMVGKLGLACIEPGSTYVQGSTGPVQGARLLLGDRHSPADLDASLVELDAKLKVGMQVLEDAICNWQKSPDQFKRFRG